MIGDRGLLLKGDRRLGFILFLIGAGEKEGRTGKNRKAGKRREGREKKEEGKEEGWGGEGERLRNEKGMEGRV